MSDVAIRVENLGKLYHIGGPQARYKTIRESIQDGFTAPIRRAGRLIKGHAHGAAELDQTIWALKDVSFEVKQGEVVGIIGRNGAGKSTLLKILSRITEPTEGELMLRGRVGSLLEVGTGFHPELTGRENIYLNGAILGMKRTEINRKFDEIVAFSEIDKFIDTPVKHYSSGMYVRLAFSVAAHLEPEVLLVDEVLAVGDARFQLKCLRKMNSISEEGRTVLFVSHNMGAVQQLCSRAFLIEDGLICRDGNVASVVHDYLSMGLDQVGERIWADIKSSPGNNTVRLQSVRIRGENGEIQTAYTVRDLVILEVEYTVLTKCPLDVYFYVNNERGECVFVTIDNNNSPWASKARPVGSYRNTCMIPGDFLNAGSYTVHNFISQNLDKRVMHVAARDVLNFSVVDDMDASGVRGNYAYKWPTATVRPRLIWNVEYLGEHWVHN